VFFYVDVQVDDTIHSRAVHIDYTATEMISLANVLSHM